MAFCGDGAGGDKTKADETGLTSKMDDIIQEIFSACDTENSGNVPTNRLVEFVAKYFNNSLTDWRIVELQSGLDPSNKNRNIDIGFFANFWPKWVEKIQGDCNETDEKLFLQNSNFKDSHNSISLSFKNTENSFQSERIKLEEKLNEVMHQNKILNEDLTLIKNQLQYSEDQVEILQLKLENERKKNLLESQRLEVFENLQAEFVKLQEEPEEMKKQINNLHKQLALLKKENSLAEMKIEELENEKKLIDEAKEKMNRTLTLTLEDLLKLEQEFKQKEQEAIELNEENLKLKHNLQELGASLEYLNNELEKQKTEKTILEKHFRTKGDTKGNLLKHILTKKNTKETNIPIRTDKLKKELHVHKINDENDTFQQKINTQNTTLHKKQQSEVDKQQNLVNQQNDNENIDEIKKESISINFESEDSNASFLFKTPKLTEVNCLKNIVENANLEENSHTQISENKTFIISTKNENYTTPKTYNQNNELYEKYVPEEQFINKSSEFSNKNISDQNKQFPNQRNQEVMHKIYSLKSPNILNLQDNNSPIFLVTNNHYKSTPLFEKNILDVSIPEINSPILNPNNLNIQDSEIVTDNLNPNNLSVGHNKTIPKNLNLNSSNNQIIVENANRLNIENNQIENSNLLSRNSSIAFTFNFKSPKVQHSFDKDKNKNCNLLNEVNKNVTFNKICGLSSPDLVKTCNNIAKTESDFEFVVPKVPSYENLNLISNSTLANFENPCQNHSDIPSSSSTLPSIYILERTNGNNPEIKITNEILEPECSLHETSSEQDLFWKVQLLNTSVEQHESLQEEISQASLNASDTNCEENQFLSVKCDLNCVYYLNKQKEEISQLEIAQNESQAKIQNMEQSLSDLRVELCVKEEKYKLLQEENINLKIELDKTKEEYAILQLKTKDLTNIEEKYSNSLNENENLLKENSEKYIRIIELQNRSEDLELQLKNEIAIRNEENTKLNEIITKLRNENNFYLKEIDNLKSQNNNLYKNNQSSEEINELFNDKITDLLKDKEELMKELENKLVENKRLKEEVLPYENLQKEVNKVNEKYVNKNLEFEKLNEEYNKMLEDWQNKYDKLNEENNRINDQMKLLQKINDDKLKEYESKIEVLNSAIREKEAMILDLNYDLKMEKDCRNKLVVENKEMLKNFVELEDCKLNYENKIKELENRMSENDIKMEETQLQIIEFTEKECELQNLLKETQNRYETLNTEHIDILNQYSQLKDTKDTLNNEFYVASIKTNNLSTKIDEQAEEIVKLNIDVTKSKEQLENLKGEIQNKDEKINDLKIQNKELKTKNNELKAKTDIQDEVVDRLKSNMHIALENLETIEVKTKIKDENLCMQCQELIEIKEQLAYLEHINQGLLKENENLKLKIDEFELDFGNLNNALVCQDNKKALCSFNKMEIFKDKLQVKIDNLELELKDKCLKLGLVSQELLEIKESFKLERSAKEKLEISLENLQQSFDVVKEENNNLKSFQNCNENGLELTKKLKDKSCKDLENYEDNINVVKNVLNEKIKTLESTINNFLTIWKPSLSKLASFNNIVTTNNMLTNFKTSILTEQLLELSHKTIFVEKILRCLCEIKANSNRNLCVFCVNTTNIPSTVQEINKNETKTVKKPILRSSTLIVSTADSPTVQVPKKFVDKDSQTEKEEENREIGRCRCQKNADYKDTSLLLFTNSPSFSEEFLTMMNLTEMIEFSDEELAQKYTQIIQAFKIDQGTLKSRLNQAENQKKSLENKILTQGAQMVSLIESLYQQNKYLETDLQHLKALVENCLKTASSLSISYELLGALKHEGKVLGSVNVLVNYSGSLQRNLHKYMQICKPIDYSLNGSGDVWFQNVLFECQNLRTTASNANIFNNKCAICKNNCSCCSKSSPKSSTNRICSRLFQFATVTMVTGMFLLSLFIFTNMVMEVEYSRRGYNSRISTWAEALVPWIKKEFPYGPPPM